jgi:hypothetical protein
MKMKYKNLMPKILPNIWKKLINLKTAKDSMIQKIIKEANKKQPLLLNSSKKSETLKKKWKNNFKKKKMKN